MAIKTNKLKSSNKDKKNKRKPNWLLRFTLIVIAVPVLILAWTLVTSLETSGEPVVGDRFDNQLDPAITDSQLTEVKNALQYPEAESVSVNLESATLRVTINTIDTATREQIEAIMNDAYNQVSNILPIETYFTNREGVKMYDLEIHVFNFIPDDTNRDAFIYYVLTKNAAATEPSISNPSTPRNEEQKNKVESLPKVGEQVGQ